MMLTDLRIQTPNNKVVSNSQVKSIYIGPSQIETDLLTHSQFEGDHVGNFSLLLLLFK